MQNTRIQRFDFNSLRDFRGPIVMKSMASAAPVEDLPPPPPPPPTFSQQELDAVRMEAKREGYNEGFNAGSQQAKKDADQRTEEANQLVSRLGGSIDALRAEYNALLTRESAELGPLVLAVARKVAGDALDARGEQVIFALIERCLPVVLSKPKVCIELHPDMFERAIERIEGYLTGHGFEGEIHFKANTEFDTSDVRLDWGNGQVERTSAALWQEIDALISRVPLELTFAETLENNEPPAGA